MKNFDSKDIVEMNKVFRLNLINSVSGYKAANLIGTKSEHGENLAIISSVFHLGSNPPLLGFIMRPATVPRHTLENIRNTKLYTINQVTSDIIEKAHYTSIKFDKGISEFEKCNLKPEYLGDSTIPFVEESKLKMLLELKEEIPIKSNDTILIVGEIIDLYVAETAIRENGQLNLPQINTACISGLNTYLKAEEVNTFPYAREAELPQF